ncbi:hypothetical protein [Ferribacterium limneticum]|nr:hypothetical protein [Ferribacterium limneticum]UCV27774.1 hypothetical protein KI617_16170 [Ferribacterium limneticum]UCV31691.1 hypothetical protein KI608_16170 [Ferribacterium limneticum]
MQIQFQQAHSPSSPWLVRFISPVSRYLPDSLYTSLAIAAGLLWLALISF